MSQTETHGGEEALARAAAMFEALREMSIDPPGVTRPAFSPEENRAHALAAEEARSLGMSVHWDAAGNQFMVMEGADPEAPSVMIGSHMDTVAHGGNYDGAAGVVLSLAAARVLKDRGVRPERDLVVIAIRSEELVWFPTPYCGSRMAFARLPPEDYERLRRSDTGRSLAHHIEEAGFDPGALISGAKGLDPGRIRAFIEPHIEQGPVLDEAGEAIGIVSGIRGNVRYPNGRIRGRWAHAGAVPREHRHDAVRAGAALVGEVERLWDEADAAGTDFVATFGKFATDATQHAMTKVAGDVAFTLDMRSLDDDFLQRTHEALERFAAATGERFGVEIDLGEPTSARPALMDEALMTILTEEAEAAGVSHRTMASGGGHDCATFAAEGVPSTMLFIRNQNGSHNPQEAMRMEDFAAALTVFAAALARLVGP